MVHFFINLMAQKTVFSKLIFSFKLIWYTIRIMVPNLLIINNLVITFAPVQMWLAKPH